MRIVAMTTRRAALRSPPADAPSRAFSPCASSRAPPGASLRSSPICTPSATRKSVADSGVRRSAGSARCAFRAVAHRALAFCRVARYDPRPAPHAGWRKTMGHTEPQPIATELKEAAEERYLNYALSVITARALPDVRDGLKPVQRRILYAMYQNLHLTAGSRPRKSAAIVGDVLGKFHPHGDLAAYEAMVRMAQPFALRYPLVHGEGNFGSLDGDSPAAMRYTEARLTAIAEELLRDIRHETVDFRENYDATLREPVVLPAAIPQLLMNGSTGIAVGMATNIPPHNLGEVVEALVALIRDPNLTSKDLCKYVKGPDFPTGGEILNSRAELRAIYDSGQGGVRLRGQYE